MKRSFLFFLLSVSFAAVVQSQQFHPGQPVDVSATMTEAGWASGCTFVDGPHAENNGYNRVKCGPDTFWAATKWIRPATNSAPRAAGEGTYAMPESTAARSASPPRSTTATRRGATQPNGQPCAAGSWAKCTPAGSEPSTATHLTPGKYECFTGNPTHYTFMDIYIKSGSVYADKGGASGSYNFDSASQNITFTSGSLRSYHSKLLSGNRIGLSTEGGNFYATTCELH